VRKFVIFLLVFLLPLQWGTAAVAAYCLHEEIPSAQGHLGHHAHHHAHPTAEKSDDGQAGKWDASCAAEHEHSHCTHAIFAASRVSGILTPDTNDSPYRTFIPDPPSDNLLRPPQAVLA